MSQTPDFGDLFRNEFEQIAKSLAPTFRHTTAFDALLLDSATAIMADTFKMMNEDWKPKTLAPVFDQISETITATIADSEPFRSLLAKNYDAITALYAGTLPDFRLSGWPENLELSDGAVELSEPSSVSGTSQGDVLSEVTNGLTLFQKFILALTLIQTLLAIVQIFVALRPDPQLVEMTEILRLQNELLLRIADAVEALPTGGR